MLALHVYVLALGVGDRASGEYRRHHRIEYAGQFDVLAREAGGHGWLAIKPAFESGRLRGSEEVRSHELERIG